MSPLLAAPTEEQASLLEVVYRGREMAGDPGFQRVPAGRPMGMYEVGKRGVWPIFQYIEGVLYQDYGLEARRIMADCPIVPIQPGHGRYGWLWFHKPSVASLTPDDVVGLTIAGMTRLPRASAEVEVFLDVLAVLIERERAFRPSPTEVQAVEMGSTDLVSHIDKSGRRWALGAAQLHTLADLIQAEPSTWNCHFVGTEPDQWRLRLSPFIRNYANIANGDEYVERVLRVIAPTRPVAEELHTSALSLPEAIDYLNAVWRVHAGGPLVRISRVEGAVKLALDAGNGDEFEARLSALCGILGHVDLPGARGHGLNDLKTYLEEKLGTDASGRASTAVDDLRALFDLRVWRQHPGTDERGRRGMQRLGIDLPTSDWQDAWRHVQARTVAALASLREEVETLT